MNYFIDSAIYRNIFGVPVDVVDKHIKLATHSALKVLLFIMRNGIEAIDDSTPKTLGITQAELDEAYIYWANLGILKENGKESSSAGQSSVADSPAIARNEHPDRTEVARRIAESGEIAHVLRQAELVFGRTLKQSELSSLIYIMDSLGLKASVTLMLVQFAKAEGKLSPAFMESTAVKWANEGIDSVRAAEKEMQEADVKRSAWRVVSRAMGIDSRRPSKKEEEAAVLWVNDWAFSDKMLRLAYDECVDHTGKFSISYTMAILEGWHKAGIDSPEKVNAIKSDEGKTPSKSKKKKSGSSETPSFDIDLFEQMLNGKKEG